MDTMDTKHFRVAYIEGRKSPWQMTIKPSFAGKKIRRFAETEAEAWAIGSELVQQIRSKGTDSLAQSTGMPLRAVADAFRKRQMTKSKSHSDKCNQVCDMLQSRFEGVAIQPRDLMSWFETLQGSETTRAMYYRYVRMFFRWAHKMGYIEKNPSTVLDAPKAAVGREILSASQMRALLEVEMPDWVRACVLLAGFAGLRTAELLRMNWEDVDTKTGQIHIRPGVGKATGGFDQRITDFTEPLARRKKLFAKRKGKLVPVTARKFHYARNLLATALQWAHWPDNCLRHSYATYHLSRSKNASLTAYQMGHTSPAMVQRVYAVPATRADADAWWVI